MIKSTKTDRKRSKRLHEALAPERLSNVADVGARIMSTPAYDMIHKLGFEPDEGAFAAIEELQQENATYFKQAIDKKGKATFYRHPIGSISSTFPIDESSARFLGKFQWIGREIGEIPMALTALDSIKEMPRLDLLKMDLQGGELGVLQGGKIALSEAVAIIPEVRFHREVVSKGLAVNYFKRLPDEVKSK